MIGIAFLALIVLILIAPFLIRVPPLQGTLPAEQLAEPDSHFIPVNGLSIHYKQSGEGQPSIILLHGFGASAFSWQEVMVPLGQLGNVIAYDRPAFGLTERPMHWKGANPYGQEAQVKLLFGLMDQLGIQRAILVGNSAGGAIAAQAALERPERVLGLVLVDPAVGSGGPNSPLLRLVFQTPQMDHLGPLAARQIRVRGDAFIREAWHDPTKVTRDVIEGYHHPLQVDHWDKALWYHSKAGQDAGLRERIKGLKIPTLIVSGDDDRIVPTEHTRALAQDLSFARLVFIKDCGHVPQEECPQAFIDAVEPFIQELI